jgi:hypothetical protein
LVIVFVRFAAAGETPNSSPSEARLAQASIAIRRVRFCIISLPLLR